ncbi:MAG: coagulation factor 5/8 type domain protein [Pedosphaera sp.]|nr:coagulation factor 5/8 type domain protein [Pedosphaera sp.]
MHINPQQQQVKVPKSLFSKSFTRLMLVIVLLAACMCADAQPGWVPSFQQYGGLCQGATNNPVLNTALSFERDDIYWDSLAPSSNTWNVSVLTNWGQTVLGYQAQGAQFLPILDYTAAWAPDKSARSWTNGTTVYKVVPTNSNNMQFYKYINGTLNSQSLLTNFSTFPPANVNTFSNFAYKVASFLHAAPYNVQYFQVWNEANWDNGYWYDSMDNYIKKIVVPSSQAIRSAGGKVVYGGWPDVSNPNSLISLLDANTAWGSIDVLDMHYFNMGDVQALRLAANSRGFTNLAIWQSEVGFTSDYTFIANYWPRALYWNLTNNWTQDKYRAFYFCNYAPNDPAAYGYNDGLWSGSALNGSGIVLTNLASVLGGSNRLSQFTGVTSIPTLSPQVWPTMSSMEAFSYSTNIAIVIHLTPTDLTNNPTLKLYLPIPPGEVASLLRVDVSGGTSNLLSDNACGLVASGVGSQFTVPTADVGGSLAQSWNSGSSTPVFYVLVSTYPNIALNKAATASSLESSSYPASYAVDGNRSTRWSSAYSDPQWIYVDLGGTYSISRVKLNWDPAYAKSYQLQVSSDAVNWITIYSTTNGTGGINDLAGLSGIGRYVRMYGTSRGTPYGYSLNDFEVYGISFSLSLGQPAYTSSIQSSNYLASMAMDGNASTRWASTSGIDPQWIYVDLGATYSISRVILNWESAYAKSYQIQVSSDAINWTTIYSTTTGVGGINDLTGLSGVGRYVRMYGTVRGTIYGYSLFDFSVYGVPASISLNRPVTASSIDNSSDLASYAVDGNGSTRWSSAYSDPQWIYVDLGTAHTISRVTLTWETAYGKSYQIQVSSDAVNWTNIYSTTTGNGGTNDLIGLSGVGRYVRMYGTVRGTIYGYSLYEFSIYDTPSSQLGLTGVSGPSQMSLKTTSGSATKTGALALTVANSDGSLAQMNAINSIPSPWVTQDIGGEGMVGSASYLDEGSGLFTISGSGSDIWKTKDQCYFVYQTCRTNSSVIARVVTQQNTDTAAKTGVMIRETLSPGAIFAAVMVTPSSEVLFSYRGITGGKAVANVQTNSISMPCWVKLTRSGSTFAGYISSNGVSWTSLGTHVVNMANSAYFGMPMCSGVNGTLATNTFDNVRANP